jgi:hypothetical protein
MDSNQRYLWPYCLGRSLKDLYRCLLRLEHLNGARSYLNILTSGSTGFRLGEYLIEEVLPHVLSAGAVDGRMWRMMEPRIRSGDDSRLKGSLRIAAKDLRAHGRVAEEAGTAIPVAQAASQTLRLALNLGHVETFLLALPSILAALNGAKIAPTPDGQRPAPASIA